MSTQKDTQNSDVKKNVLCELCRGKFSETQQELEKKGLFWIEKVQVEVKYERI